MIFDISSAREIRRYRSGTSERSRDDAGVEWNEWMGVNTATSPGTKPKSRMKVGIVHFAIPSSDGGRLE